VLWALSPGATTYFSLVVDSVSATPGLLNTDVAFVLIDLLNLLNRI